MNPLLPLPLQQDWILASASPRRAEILQMLGFEFEVEPTSAESEPLHEPEPLAHSRAQARRKAAAGAQGRQRGTSIGADTIVVVDGEILGKPASAAEALAMLQRLRGRWHLVHTGLALQDVASGRRVEGVESTAVHFRHWDDTTLQRYVETGECADKAGLTPSRGSAPCSSRKSAAASIT